MKIKILLAFLACLFLTTSCKREKKEYYPDGRLKSVQQYKGKKQQGVSTWYYDNGKK